MTDPQVLPTRYWATEPAFEKDEITGEVRQGPLGSKMSQRIQEFYQAAEHYGRLELWRRSSRMYFGLDSNGSWASSSALTYGGNRGELVMLRINFYRSFVQHIHTLVAGERPAVNVRAGTNSHQSAERAIFARALIDIYFRKGVEKAARRAALYGLYWGEGWVYLVWNQHKGRITGGTEEALVREGDIHCVPLRPIDVIRDPASFPEGDDDDQWVIVRRKQSRWDLMKEFQGDEEMVEHIRTATNEDNVTWETFRYKEDSYLEQYSDDTVITYELWHKPCLSLPLGRYALMVGDKVLRESTAHEIPAFKICPDQEEDSPFGYSPCFDLLAPQEAYDSFITTMLTNHDATGVQNFWTRRGDKLSVHDLAGALKHLQSDEEPKVLQMTAISEHTYRLESLMQDIFEKLTGISGTLRGDPPANLESGSALALLDAKAVQFNSGFQADWTNLITGLGKHMLNVLHRNVHEERVAEIASDTGSVVAKSWTGKDLEDLGDVVVEIANPGMFTMQGRRALADKYAEMGWIKGPEQYTQVVTSGTAEPILKQDRDEMRLIAEENQTLMQGQPVRAAITDRHSIHIREHAAGILNKTDRRDNESIMNPTVDHLMEHIQMLQQADPMLLMILGDPSAQMLMMNQAQQGPEPPGDAPKEGESPGLPEDPEMPVDPSTGDQTEHPTGAY